MPTDKRSSSSESSPSDAGAAQKVVFVDAFTRMPFQGNPCAVVLGAQGLSGPQMLAIARETNAPETAFVLPSQRADIRVRYFTPRAEMPFAGHPTIATAHLLAREGLIPLHRPLTVLEMEFNIGVLPVEISLAADNRPRWVRILQPAPQFGPRVAAAETAAALGLAGEDLRSDLPVQVVNTGVPFLCVPATGMAALRRVDLDRPRLKALLQGVGVNAAYLFCMEALDPRNHAHARLLDPDNPGEDPYTGAAAGCLGAFAFHHRLHTGSELRLEQGHLLARPGEGVLDIVGNPDRIEGVGLRGAAVRTLEGRLLGIPDGE